MLRMSKLSPLSCVTESSATSEAGAVELLSLQRRKERHQCNSRILHFLALTALRTPLPVLFLLLLGLVSSECRVAETYWDPRAKDSVTT